MLLLLWATVVLVSGTNIPLSTLDHWAGGFNAKFMLSSDHELNGWCAHIVFDSPVDKIEIWKGTLVKTCSGNQEYLVKNMAWDAQVSSGSPLEVRLTVRISGADQPPGGHVFITDACSACGGDSGNSGVNTGGNQGVVSGGHQGGGSIVTPAATPGSGSVGTPSSTMQAWITVGSDTNRRLTKLPYINPSNSGNGVQIKVDTSKRMQTMEGFGAAITSSAAYVIKNSNSYDQIIEDLFGTSGIGISVVRVPMGGCDFMAENPYSYADVPNDYNMDHFSIDKDKHFIIPVLKKALEKNPQLKVIGTPWSAPAWMKANNNLFGGELKSDNNVLSAYAKYFLKFVQQYANEGITIYAITVQNEPKFSTNEYPSMSMSPAQQADFIKNHLGPTFRQNNIRTKILTYDHNWDAPQYPSQVLSDSQTAQYISGVAWHCYGGDYWQPGTFHNSHPNIGQYFTECSGTASSSNFDDNLVWNMRILFIGQPRNWAKSVLLWNMALDENHGPKVGVGGCKDCRGVLTVPSYGGNTKEVEYYVIGHLSKVVKPGAVRLSSSNFQWDDLNNVAFQNPDNTIAIIVLNPSSSSKSFNVAVGGSTYNFGDLPGKSVVSLLV